MKDTYHRPLEEFEHEMFNDDIDQLYCQLAEITPPAALVDAIMASVARLSQPQDRLSERLPDDLTLSKLLMSGFKFHFS